MQLSTVTEFMNDAKQIETLQALKSRLDTVTQPLGITHIACVGHANPRDQVPNLVHVHDYPSDWANLYVEHRLETIDPVMMISRLQMSPIIWRDPRFAFKCSRAQEKMLSDARDHGLDHGISFPIHARYMLPATFSVSFSAPMTDPNVIHALHLIALFFHEAAARIVRDDKDQPVPKLTDRQRECLDWVSAGKSTWDISQILNVSEATVYSHIQSAMVALNATTRAHAVARALRFGLLSSLEIGPSAAHPQTPGMVTEP